MGLAPAAGEQTMRRSFLFVASAVVASVFGIMPHRTAAATAGLQRQPGGNRGDGVRGQLRQLPHGGSGRSQRGAATGGQQFSEHVAQSIHARTVRVHPVDDAADGREPVDGAVSLGDRLYPAGKRRGGRRGGADRDHRGADRQRRDRGDSDHRRSGRSAGGWARGSGGRTSGHAPEPAVRAPAADAAALQQMQDL